MKNLTLIIIFNFCLFAFGISCQSQGKQKDNYNKTREAVYAGQFYESDSKKLETELTDFFKNAILPSSKNVLAIISPHAGYIYSGQVAASSFNQVNPDFQYKRVFILAPSHQFAFDGAAVYNRGNFKTPLGEVVVDCDFASELITKDVVFKDMPEAHEKEHAIEVQLPFLQKRLKSGYKIVPIIIGTQDQQILKKVATFLKPYLNEENLFVISSDFSHYPAYKSAIENDKASALAIVKNSPGKLLKQLQENDSKNIQNLLTNMCGEAGIMCLLYMTENMQNIEYKLIDYKNSGDSKLGDKERVVGYWAISLVEKESKTGTSTGFELNKEDKDLLIKIARETLNRYIKTGEKYKLEPEKYPEDIKTKCGAFVTLSKKGQLRGCVGSFAIDEPLYKVVRDMAISASSEDPRFPKVRESELKNIDIEISVLTPMQKIDSIAQIEIGKHGIYIKNGSKRGTLLPRVANENNWSAGEFVKYCAIYKAGIDEDEIKNSELFVYEAIVFHEVKD